ncbi:flagellar hook-length control protein FliK [Bacillus salacetis]|uniref:flagellar hook-length control protein FliK n=1 Tax=Bacillus salacetis TaxID=2315464 RepID=UPI003B9F44FA
MNVGAMLSTTSTGQVSDKGLFQKTPDGEKSDFFSRLLADMGSLEGASEQEDTRMVQLLKLLQVLNSGQAVPMAETEAAEINMENILLQAGITQEDLLVSMESIINDILKDMPMLKEQLPQVEKGNQEEVLFLLMETISLMPAANLKQLDPAAMEILFKTSKAFEKAFSQSDLSFQQTERAEVLQQSLKVITEKIEQVLTGAGQKDGKWNQIVEKVFHTHFTIKEDVNPKTHLQNIVMDNKYPGETLSKLTLPSNKSLLSLHMTPADSSGEKMAKYEGEQAAKPNAGLQLTGLFGQQQLVRAEQFSLFVNKSQTGTTYEQFVKEFANIIGKSQMMHTPNMSKLLIKLYPEQLGSLRIELLQQEGILTAKIIASTKAAKDILDSQLTGLRQALNSQNLQVEKIEVAQSFTESYKQERQPSQQQNGQQSKDQSNQQTTDKEEPEFSFQELLMNSEV